jgi:hypothetical protein
MRRGTAQAGQRSQAYRWDCSNLIAEYALEDYQLEAPLSAPVSCIPVRGRAPFERSWHGGQDCWHGGADDLQTAGIPNLWPGRRVSWPPSNSLRIRYRP